nr:aldehyde dehydrogenase family protein [Haloferax marisrubri]
MNSYDGAVTITSDAKYGLWASIVTEIPSEAPQFVDGVEAGVIKVNEKTAGLDFFTTSKTVYPNY